ncbi:MAG TPA: helix-turn-helix domain-containing protein [Sphingomicrobium sp.]|nr:helix-turn-helix domain-containing protein [Sphingomicrobium sp.]
MIDDQCAPIEALIVAVPETAGSALYGMLDVLAATGNLWQQLVGDEPPRQLIRPRIVSDRRKAFLCGNGIPVRPDCFVGDDPRSAIIILPELWLGPDEDISGRYDAITEWVRHRYKDGASIYSACSGSIMLAETGLLDGRAATSHWGFERAFRTRYPQVEFKPEPALQFADPAGRIVTAGGTTSWHDLAIHIVARHCSPGEAARIAKVYLLKTHDEGQLPYAALVREAPHADGMVRECEARLKRDFREPCAVSKSVAQSPLPERTLKRRFKAATGLSIIDYVQNLRIEEAKHLLETTDQPVDGIGAQVGYDNLSFFRQLFRRRCGLSPARYRRLFRSG